MKRIEYFEYFKHFAFDKFAMEPRLPAFSLAYHSKNAHDLLFEKFTETEFKNYSQLIEKENQLQTSSVGRLFDAVASLIGCGDINSFEGEAAMKLENLALQFYQTKKEDCGFYCFKKEDKLSPHIIINEIINDINNQLDKGKIALKFHYTLVEIVKFVAQKYQIEILAFSGGVFQNALLIDLLIEKLNKDFDLYFHQQLSPNDENISFGQLVYIENNLK
jgi:hydrogenase maturation protein HypF